MQSVCDNSKDFLSCEKFEKKREFWFKALIATTLFTDPFLLTHSLFNYSAIVDYTIMSFMLVWLLANRSKRTDYISILCLMAFVIYVVKLTVYDGTSAFRGDNLSMNIKAIYAILFMYVAYGLVKWKKLISQIIIWQNFFYWISVCSIVTLVLYKIGAHFLFIRGEVLGYPVEQIPFIGVVHYDHNMKIRPSWFFYEPSYLGTALGLNLLIVCREYYKMKKYKHLVTYILAILLSGSMTGIGCCLVALAMTSITKALKINPIVAKILVLILVPMFIFFYSSYDARDNNSDVVASSSLIDRQNRVNRALDYVLSAKTEQLLFGIGKDYVNDFKGGVANAYLGLLIADGAIILLLYLIVVFVLLYRTDYEFYFNIIAMNMIDLNWLPFWLLMFVVINQYYKARSVKKPIKTYA
jgi:hypothetical protein